MLRAQPCLLSADDFVSPSAVLQVSSTDRGELGVRSRTLLGERMPGVDETPHRTYHIVTISGVFFSSNHNLGRQEGI